MQITDSLYMNQKLLLLIQSLSKMTNSKQSKITEHVQWLWTSIGSKFIPLSILPVHSIQKHWQNSIKHKSNEAQTSSNTCPNSIKRQLEN